MVEQAEEEAAPHGDRCAEPPAAQQGDGDDADGIEEEREVERVIQLAEAPIEGDAKRNAKEQRAAVAGGVGKGGGRGHGIIQIDRIERPLEAVVLDNLASTTFK